MPLQNCGAIPELRHAFQDLWNNDRRAKTREWRRGTSEEGGGQDKRVWMPCAQVLG
jgi:hypothetical protein